MFDLKEYLQKKRSIINNALQSIVYRKVSDTRLKSSVSYSLFGQGKRLRPILCIASYNAVSSDDHRAVLPIACALECVHTYSLIHDDLPALDDDALRRGNPTCHVQFDEATAILTGDALLTLAFEIVSDESMGASSAQDLRNYLQVIKILSEAAGCRGMIEGQARDLAFEGVKLNEQELQQMHDLKTGAMIRACVQSGAILGNAQNAEFENLTLYAAKIGLAFQVTDDILNVTGDPERLGKNTGTDAIRGKNTYPGLLGLENAMTYAQSLIGQALRALKNFDDRAKPLRAIAGYIIERSR